MNDEKNVDIKVTVFTHPDVVRMEIIITGEDAPTRDKVGTAIKEAIENIKVAE